MAVNRRMALLIDGDNAQAALLGEILAEASKYGLLTIRRVYGDWTEPQLKSWKQVLHTYAIQPVQQFRYTVGKNATDSAMIIDAMDILYTAGVDGFCLVSSDSDYTRLATRIREKNLFVMGIGKQTTPRAFVNACDVFVYTENISASGGDNMRLPSENTSPAETTPEADNLERLFRNAFEATAQDDGWATLSAIGNKLGQLDPGFDPRTYGYRQLLHLVQARKELFEIRKTKVRGGAVVYVRLREQE
ncbi:MAG: NYN domain-containing protein [Chloroflexi bacterium]|nr:NYN domain-containing protein [Chloroflexota bacterium]